MTNEELIKSVENLSQVTVNIKAEVLDIKEVLADYDDNIKNVTNAVDEAKVNFNQQLNNSLSSYISSDEIADLYYNKSQIDSKFDNLDYVNMSDVDKHLASHDYITSDSLKGLVNVNKLNSYFDLYLEDYKTKEQNDRLYVTKSELEDITGNTIDLSSYVNMSYLQDNYYTKGEVEHLIPSVSGFVKKSELHELLHLDDYALIDDVKNNYVRKGEIKLDNYVTSDMLTESLSKFDDKISESYLKSTLKDYVKTNLFDESLNNLSKSITEEYIPLILSNFKNENKFLTKNDVKGFVTKDEFLEHVQNSICDDITDISEFVKKSDLDNYTTKSDLDNSILNIQAIVKTQYIPDSLDKFKAECGYLTEDEAKHVYATKEEFRRYIMTGNTSFDDETLKDYVKSDDLNNYVKTTTLDTGLNKVVSNITDVYVPNALTTFKTDNKLVSQPYVDRTFATKKELLKYIEENNNNLSNLDANNFVKKTELNDYASKSDMSNYVDYGVFNNNIISVNGNISTLSNSLKKYVLLAQLVDYVREDNLMSFLNGYVTKENLSDELKKLTENGDFNFDIDISKFLTFDDYEKLKNYIQSSLEKYVPNSDVYSKKVIDNNFVKVSDINENYYTKEDIDNKYLSKNTAFDEYLTLSDAYSDFLSKEDYRGIKNAMTLNSAYKHSKEIFEALLENSKLLDGFYLVEDGIVVVKDNKPYSTNLTGSNSYTKNEIDDMNFVTKDYLTESYKGKNWKIDTGGNY